MWERHASDDVIEFPMTVTSIEVPAPGRKDPDEQTASAVTAEPVDQTLMPRQGTGTWPNGERAVRLGHAEEILITLALKPFEAMDVARLGGVDASAQRFVVRTHREAATSSCWGSRVDGATLLTCNSQLKRRSTRSGEPV